MGIRAFSHPAGISWARADWCLDRILAAGEGPIPGDWEDQGERSPVGRQGPGPGTCCSLALPRVPGIGTSSARRQYLEEEGTHIAARARGFGALGTRWERRLGPVRGLARFHCRQMAACEGVREQQRGVSDGAARGRAGALGSAHLEGLRARCAVRVAGEVTR